MAGIPIYFTTSTAPPFTFIFADASGNVPPGFSGATATMTFRSMSTGAKVRGTGPFTGFNGTTGAVTYTLSSTDMASAYAISALGLAVGGALPGIELFELISEATIGVNVYDGQIPPQIYIRKI